VYLDKAALRDLSPEVGLSEISKGAWERKPRTQIKRDIQQGVLLGNELASRCRVEITTKASQGLPPTRQLNIWVGEILPAGEYLLVIKGETLRMQYSQGLWREITPHDLAERQPGAA